MAESERPAPLKLDITVDRESPEQDLRKIFSTIRPEWKEEGKLKFDTCPGCGFINITLLATYKGNRTEGVVVRIFFPTYEHIMHRERELASIQVFNRRGLTPQVYCIFNNGVCMAFIHKGVRFDWAVVNDKPLRDEKVGRAAARELAKYHSKKTSDMAKEMFAETYPMEPELRRKMRECLTNWPDNLGKEAEELFYAKFPTQAALETEWKTVLSAMEELDLPLAVCHHDAHPANLLYVPEDDRVIFVDYEMSGFDWPTMDLATFLEFSAIGLARRETIPDRHPEPYRKMFLREYLETKRRQGDLDHDVTDLDVERLFVQTEKATLAFYVCYTGICLMVANGPERNGFSKKDFVQLTLNQYEWYEKNKERILAMEVPQ